MEILFISEPVSQSATERSFSGTLYLLTHNANVCSYIIILGNSIAYGDCRMGLLDLAYVWAVDYAIQSNFNFL